LAWALPFSCDHLPEMMSLFIAGSPWLQRRSYRGSSFAQRLLNAGQPAMK
jgi:hypothetical protein